jgi:hypothetical protein
MVSTRSQRKKTTKSVAIVAPAPAPARAVGAPVTAATHAPAQRTAGAAGADATAGAADAGAARRKSRVSFGPSVQSPKASRESLHRRARISPAIKAKAARGPLEEDHWLRQSPGAKKRRRCS